MSDSMNDLPRAEMADPDGVQVALRAAHTLWSHGDTAESLRWLSRAAESASDEGADVRSLQLAKAAADLRSRLVGSLAPGSSPVAGGQSSIPQAKQGLSQPASAVPTPLVARPTDIPMAAIPVPGPGSVAPAMSPAWSGEMDSSPPPLPPTGSLTSNDHRGAVLANTEVEPPPSDMQHWLASSAPAPMTSQVPPMASTPPAPSIAPPAIAPPALATPAIASPALATPAIAPPSGFPGAMASPAVPSLSIPPPLPAMSYGQQNSRPAAFGPPYSNAALSADPRSEQHTIAIDSLDEDSTDSVSFDGQALDEDAAPLSEGGIYAVKSSLYSSRSHGNNSAEARNAHAAELNSASTVRSESIPVPVRVSSHPEPEARQVELSSQSGSVPTGASAEPLDVPVVAENVQPKLTARVHHQAVRVAVLADSLSEGQFIVRPLREGESVPAGAKVALLVALEPGTPLV